MQIWIFLVNKKSHPFPPPPGRALLWIQPHMKPFMFSIPHLHVANGKPIGVNVTLSFFCFHLPSLITDLHFFFIFWSEEVTRPHRQDLHLSPLLQDGKTPPPANPADLVVSLQCSAGAPYRKWAHNCSSTPTASQDPLPPCSNPLQNHLCWSHRMPPPQTVPFSFTAERLHQNRTLNASARFTLHRLKNTADLRDSGNNQQPKKQAADQIFRSLRFVPILFRFKNKLFLLFSCVCLASNEES